ncbi:MAG TPA: tRNA lysidine(34) synthetase TilS [Thermoanaerobaculia bacterium]|nr:tRNA lysidine(34) synthetase TilS [Thermoanaerobaculia bacterium]
MPPPREAVRAFLESHGIRAAQVIVALSGGTDSTALLLLLHAEKMALRAAHINHHLRGDESDKDQAFVEELCARLQVALDLADGTLAPDRIKAVGIEAAAREVRYARLQEIRERCGARYIATAHQKNDQAETVLMRLLTGSGMAGLRGIHPMREDGFIRPLLEVTREQLEAVLAEQAITAREDRSNRDPRFLRNRIRGIVRELDATDNLAKIAAQAREQWPLLERAIDAAETQCCIIEASRTRFVSWPDDSWLKGALLQRHIRRLDPGARDFDARKIDTNAKRVSVTKELELAGNVLQRRTARTTFASIDFEREAFIPELHATIHVQEPPSGKRQRIQLPLHARPRFTVRPRKAGDTFHPLGAAQPKKLKDFLIDRKIPRDSRDRLPLLVWNGEIVWIAGVEVSERFKVTEPAHGMLYEVWLEGQGGDDGDHAPL